MILPFHTCLLTPHPPASFNARPLHLLNFLKIIIKTIVLVLGPLLSEIISFSLPYSKLFQKKKSEDKYMMVMIMKMEKIKKLFPLKIM
jgi:hypothetical protein